MTILGGLQAIVVSANSAPTANSQTRDEEIKKIGSLLISARYSANDSEDPIMAKRTIRRARKDLTLIIRIKNKAGHIR